MMPAVYRVRDWDKHFESNKSRERDRCSFVCVPNKQHGMGFTRIMALPDGAAVYGVWCLIIGALSHQQRPREGYLTDTGKVDGRAWTVSDLAMRWRRPEAEVQMAIDALLSHEIDWIYDNCARQVPVKCPRSARQVSRNGREGKGKEENGKEEILPAAPGGETPLGKPRKRPAKKKAPPVPTDWVIDPFVAAWAKTFKTGYKFQGAKDGDAASRLARQFEDSRPALSKAIARYFADETAFTHQAGHTLAFFASRINTYTAAPTKVIAKCGDMVYEQPSHFRDATPDEADKILGIGKYATSIENGEAK